MPKREIQLFTKAMAIVSAVMSIMGMASGHRLYLSIQVSRYEKPFEGGKGPTKSMCTCSNRASGVAKVPKGDLSQCQYSEIIEEQYKILRIVNHCSASVSCYLEIQ